MIYRMHYERLTHKARKVINLAKREGFRSAAHLVGPEHVLIGVLREDTGIGAKVLKKSALNLNRLRIATHILSPLVPDTSATGEPWLSHEMRFLLDKSWMEARKLGHSYLSTEHLLLAVIMHPRVVTVLRAQDIAASGVRNYLLKIMTNPKPTSTKVAHQ